MLGSTLMALPLSNSTESISRMSVAANLSEDELGVGAGGIESKKSPVVVIVVIIVFILLLCSGSVAFGFIKASGALMADLQEFQLNSVIPLCQSAQTISEQQYENMFTDSYRSIYTYDMALGELSEAFPKGFNCDSVKTTNLLDMLKSGQSFSKSIVNGVSTVEFTYSLSDRTVTLSYLEVNGEWKVENISFILN